MGSEMCIRDRFSRFFIRLFTVQNALFFQVFGLDEKNDILGKKDIAYFMKSF